MTGAEYKRISAAVLVLAIAGLTLPLFLPLLNKMPGAGACPSLIILGKPCPLCGLTRAFHRIWHMRFAEALDFNILSIAVFLFTLLQVLFRTLIILKIDKDPTVLEWARPDARIHALLAGLYLVYALIFITVGLTH